MNGITKLPKAPSLKPLFRPTKPKVPHPGASHPHLKRSKLSVAGKSSFGSQGGAAFNPVGGGSAFGSLGGAPAAPSGADREQGPQAIQD